MRLIDANALKEIFDNRYDDAFMQAHVRANIAWWEGYCGGVNWARNTLADTNAVDAAEVVHGRWAAIDDDCEELEGEEEAMRWGCSACREIVEYNDWTHRRLLTRYCPNCGAKMDGDGNG